MRRESLRQEASRQDAASPRADAYPLDAPQPPRPPRAEAAAPPPRLPRALPPAEAAPAPPSFDEMLDLAAQETRAARAEPDPRPAPAPKPAYHPAPSSPANLDAPRRAPAVADAARASVIEEGEIAGHPYRVLADLTVEIDTVLGARAFESMEAARRFVGAPAARARSVA